MDNSYIDFDAIVRRANQERSQALADFLSTGLNHLSQWVAHLLHHHPHQHGHLANS